MAEDEEKFAKATQMVAELSKIVHKNEQTAHWGMTKGRGVTGVLCLVKGRNEGEIC